MSTSDQLSENLKSLKLDRSAPPSTRRTSSALLRVPAFAALGLAMVFGGMRAVEAAQARWLRVSVDVTEIAVVSPGRPEVRLSAAGFLRAETVSHVGSELGGRIKAVHVAEGADVTAGQLLLELDGTQRHAELDTRRLDASAAQARVELARANVIEVETQAARARQLLAQQAVPRAESEDLDNRVTTLKAALVVAEREWHAQNGRLLELARSSRALEIRSPIAGRLVSKPPKPGEVVETNREGVGLDIADLSSLILEADLPEARLGQVRLGAPCEVVIDAFPEHPQRGRVRSVSAHVDRAKGTVSVRVELLDDKQGLLPDMAARVNFLSEPATSAQLAAGDKRVVPADALLDRAGHKVVFELVGDAVHERRIGLGAALGDGFELIDGPAAGARLVKRPAPTLKDGQLVKEKS